MYARYADLRDKCGLKDSDVAKVTGISKSTFSEWKSGRSAPKTEKLIQIAKAVGTTVEYLVTGADVSPNPPNQGEQLLPPLTPDEARLLEGYRSASAETRSIIDGIAGGRYLAEKEGSSTSSLESESYASGSEEREIA